MFGDGRRHDDQRSEDAQASILASGDAPASIPATVLPLGGTRFASLGLPDLPLEESGWEKDDVPRLDKE